uniref:Uncharacterized protein n=1 Tax=Leersia perrieri TaxID=77586 RepID=A0A0D9WV20_9ORYZ
MQPIASPPVAVVNLPPPEPFVVARARRFALTSNDLSTTYVFASTSSTFHLLNSTPSEPRFAAGELEIEPSHRMIS